MTGRVVLVGAGPGDPELITLRGARALQEADVVVYDRLVSPALLELAPARAERVYVGKEPGRDHLSQERINALLIDGARRGLTVGRLKGGDPFVFGRGGEEVLACAAAGVPCEVIPGITSAVAAAAAAGIPLTHRAVARSFAVVTASTAAEAEAVDIARLAGSVSAANNPVTPSRIASRMSWVRVTPGVILASSTGSSEAGPHSTICAPNFESRYMLERATRLCAISPMMAARKPSSDGRRSRIVRASNNA